MIVICELGFPDETHVPFNAGLLTTISAAFPKEELTFFGAAQHLQELKRQVGKPLADSIAWTEIHPPPLGTAYFTRFLRELSLIRRLFRTVAHDSTSRLLLTSAYPSTVLALKVARCFKSKRIPVQIVLHGLSGVVGKRYRRPIRRFQDTRTAVTLLGNEGMQYLVLEESIRNTIRESLPFLAGKVEVLEHPISPNERTFEPLNLIVPIRFGFLGLADKAKGFPVFVELAEQITAQYGQRAEFHAIGRLGYGMPLNGTKALATKPGPALMSRDKFLLSVRLLHYIVLPHEAASYKLTASGIFLDAIALGKPVIARRIPIFESTFEKHGDIGYLFNDEVELRAIVEQILQSPDESRYNRQVSNLQNLRKSRTPGTLAATYREICRNRQGL